MPPRKQAWSAERIGKLLGARRSGRYWKAKCPAHADHSPSLLIWTDRTGRTGLWCACGCDYRDVVDQLRAIGVVVGRKLKPGEAVPERKPHPEDDERERKWIERAKTVWTEGLSIYHPSAERVPLYLKTRGLTLPAELDYQLVRYHPACPRERERAPAMLVCLRDPLTRWIIGVSRCFLDPDGRRVGDRMVMGRMGAAMFDAPERHLHACEGFETGLALYLDGRRPVWSLMAAGKLQRLPVLDGVQHLVAHLDCEPSRTGWKAGQLLYWTWHDAGRSVEMLMFEHAERFDYADTRRSADG